MATSKSTSRPQLPAQARRRAERLIEVYEREAYRTYNLALRVTCDHEAAARATESAFLRHLGSSRSDEQDEGVALRKNTIAAALAEAQAKPVAAASRRSAKSSRAKRRPPEERLREAVGVLPPSQRAALALISLDEGSAKAIAAATGASEKAARTLASEARKRLGAQLGVAANRVGPRLRDWPWEEPPAEIWEDLYPQAQRLLAERETADDRSGGRDTRGRKKGARRDGPKTRSGSALAARLLEGAPRARRVFAARFAGRGSVWAFRAAVLAIILVPAAVVALTGGGEGGRGPALSAAEGPTGGAFAPSGAADHSEGGSTYNALSPKELDQLRLKELNELRQYSQQQADKSLSASQRSDAAQRAEELLALARRRLAEAERREKAAAEAQRKAKATHPAPAPKPATGTNTGAKKRKKKQDANAPPPSGGSVSDCLFNPESGTYICPQ